MIIGTVGLWRLNLARHPLHGDAAQRPMDRGFIALLFITAASGLVLAVARQAPALPLLLSIHLASVMALFIAMPYGKFVHGVYRAAARCSGRSETSSRQLDPASLRRPGRPAARGTHQRPPVCGPPKLHLDALLDFGPAEVRHNALISPHWNEHSDTLALIVF